MEVTFDKSFSKCLDKIANKQVLERTEKVILKCEEVSTLQEITNLKKMVGYKNFYRIKIGDYRIGIEVIDNVINFIVVAPRSKIYKIFP